jgi:hypothetical protein
LIQAWRVPITAHRILKTSGTSCPGGGLRDIVIDENFYEPDSIATPFAPTGA